MGFRLTYAEILEMVANTVLDTSVARDIVRRSGLLRYAGTGGRGPITLLRLESWTLYGGEETDPTTGDTYFPGLFGDAPVAIPNVGMAASTMWLEGISEVRVNAATITPHTSARVQTGWIVYGEGTGVERYWPDTGELVYDEVTGGANTSGQVYCTLDQPYNTSGWVPFMGEWLEQDVLMTMEARDPENGVEPVSLGMCELQVR